MSYIPIILVFVGALISASGGAWLAVSQIKSSEIIESKTDEISRSITGGDAFPYFLPSFPRGSTQILEMMVLNESKYPLYEITARIVDINKMKTVFQQIKENGATLKESDLSKFEDYISIGNIGPKKAMMKAMTVSLPEQCNEYFINIFFNARNGSCTQMLRFKKIEGKWVVANKVERDSEVVFERISDKYPRNADGNVEW